MNAETQVAQSSRRCNIEQAVQAKLAATGYHPLKAIRCRFRDGTLTLRGRVPSYYHKQLAQEVIRRVGEFRAIVNEIEVPRADLRARHPATAGARI